MVRRTEYSKQGQIQPKITGWSVICELLRILIITFKFQE